MGVVGVFFFSNVLKGKRACRRVFAFVGGITGLLAGTARLAALLPKVLQGANPIMKALVVPLNGDPIPLVVLLIGCACLVVLGLFI